MRLLFLGDVVGRSGRAAVIERLMCAFSVDYGAIAEQMLGDVAVLAGEGLRVVRSHHERWDGAGYPDKLSGREIPVGARVFAVADALDAMTSDRGYNEVKTVEEAAEELVRLDTQFDRRITSMLQWLVAEGTLNKEERDLHE